MNLQGKVAVVTGGGRDIGRAISIKLAALGARVVINYFNSPADAEETLRQILANGGEALAIRADLTKWDECFRLVAETRKAYGDQIDILVNNTGGIIARTTLREMDEAFWDQIMDLNAKSTFMMIRAALDHLPAGGAIVNVASQAGRDGGGTGATAYGASKGAVVTFTRGLAKELGPQGIRVNAVCPGLIGTIFHDLHTPDEVRKVVASRTPLQREGTASEVADLVVYLASDESSFITGANVDINGGLFFS